MIAFEQARRIVLETVSRLAPEPMALAEASGLVLAEDLAASEDMPPFDRSAMDGYAVRAADVQSVPARLTLTDDIPAGAMPRGPVGPGCAARVMTGAPVPPGADTVVMVERTEPGGAEDQVVVLEAVPAGRNIRYRGEECAAGCIVLSAGRRLGPAQVALAASCGHATVAVYPRPAIAVLSTGDELVPVNREPGPGQIRDANAYYVGSRLREAVGIDAGQLGIVGDEPSELEGRLRDGLAHDVLLTSGGISAGTYDLLPGVLRELGVDMLFEQVAMQPGKPLVFGRRDPTRVFALPGNPVAVMVAVELLVLPAVRRMMGFAEADLDPPTVEAVLEAPLKHRAGRRSHRPAVLRYQPDGYRVRPVSYQGSAHIAALAEANALVVQPPEQPNQPAGSTVTVVRLGR